MMQFNDILRWGLDTWNPRDKYQTNVRTVYCLNENEQHDIKLAFKVLRVVFPQDYHVADIGVHFAFTYLVFDRTDDRCVILAKSIAEAETAMVNYCSKHPI